MNSSSWMLSSMMQRASCFVAHHQLLQQRFMSKYLSKSATRRLPLNTKRAGKGYYKGKGGTKEGKINSKARFIVDPKKRLELIVPDLEGFTVSYSVSLVEPTMTYLHDGTPLIDAQRSFLRLQLKPYIASTASKIPPEIRRRPGQAA